MDVYSLIESRAIGEHCRRIGHHFTPLETAFLVYDNDALGMAQKHALYREIVETLPDMEVEERTWTPHFDSLHELLRTYMALEDKYLALFSREESGCVYSFAIWYRGDACMTEDDRLFPSLAACRVAIGRDIEDLREAYGARGRSVEPLEIRVKKQWIGNEDEEHPRHITVRIDEGGQPLEIYEDAEIVTPEDGDVLHAFFGLWPEIPTPFVRGDILVARCARKEDERPFVLDWIPYWEEDGKHTRTVERMRESGDGSDLGATIYGQDEDGTVWHDHGPSYLRMEYCDRPLQGAERILTAVSSYLKDDISLELLLRAYDVLKGEQRVAEARSALIGFTDEGLVKAGLKDGE